MRNKILINCKENYNRYNPITKERKIFESPFYLKLGPSGVAMENESCSPLTGRITRSFWIILRMKNNYTWRWQVLEFSFEEENFFSLFECSKFLNFVVVLLLLEKENKTPSIALIDICRGTQG